MVGSGAPPNFPLKVLSKTYADVELAGHSPNTPWWVSPLAVFGAIFAFMFVYYVLVHWF